MSCPSVKKNLTHIVDIELQPSEDVIVHVENYGLSVGRYYHKGEFWSVNGMTGDFKVLEWWPLPEIGTGNKA